MSLFDFFKSKEEKGIDEQFDNVGANLQQTLDDLNLEIADLNGTIEANSQAYLDYSRELNNELDILEEKLGVLKNAHAIASLVDSFLLANAAPGGALKVTKALEASILEALGYVEDSDIPEGA